MVTARTLACGGTKTITGITCGGKTRRPVREVAVYIRAFCPGGRTQACHLARTVTCVTQIHIPKGSKYMNNA